MKEEEIVIIFAERSDIYKDAFNMGKVVTFILFYHGFYILMQIPKIAMMDSAATSKGCLERRD